MDFLKLILRNLRRQLRRTLLTMLTVTLATLIFAVLVAVPSSMDRLLDEAGRGMRLIITNRTGPYGLPAQYCDEIRKLPYVNGCVAILQGAAVYRDIRNIIPILAVDPETLTLASDYGIKPAQVAVFTGQRRAAVAGSALWDKYHWHLGQEIILQDLDKHRIPVILVGTIPGDHYPNLIIFRRDYLIDVLEAAHYPFADRNRKTASLLMITVDAAEHIPLVIRTVDSHFHNAEDETRTQTESNTIAGALATVGNVRAIIYSLCVVVILTVMMVAANAMAMMVRERLNDIAVMRALGFGRGTVAILLFGEAGAIGLIGGALGSTLALWLFAAGIDLGAVTAGMGLIKVTPAIAAEGVALAFAVTLIASAIPVLTAMRVTPAMAFRQVV
jgi:putative ABC transport system permease protein